MAGNIQDCFLTKYPFLFMTGPAQRLADWDFYNADPVSN